MEDMSPPNLGPTMEELFEEGMRRLHVRDTWKLWRWPQSDNVFYSPDEFKYVTCMHACCRQVADHICNHHVNTLQRIFLWHLRNAACAVEGYQHSDRAACMLNNCVC